jgi:hypothetical protein
LETNMKIRLSIAAGSGAPTTFEHAGPVIRIGRDPDCELALRGEAADRASRQHARIELSAGGVILTDLGSTNGTRLNEQLLKGPGRLRVGDRIHIGYLGATLTVVELELPAPPAVGRPTRKRPVLVMSAAAAALLVVALAIVLWPSRPKGADEGAPESVAAAPGVLPADTDRSPSPSQPTPSPPRDQDFEVLASGPVHEAYAQPVDYQPQPGPVVPKRPPEDIYELPPDQKPDGEDVQWLSGYWAWAEDRKDYLWVSGLWRDAPPGRHWVPGAWQEVEGGWVWSAGFWADTEEVTYLESLPEYTETAPSEPAPGPDHVFAAGTWVWQDGWFWRPGYWVPPQPGWVWATARYIWTPAGYVFVDGYWDRLLERRGLLFAPARILRRSLVEWTYVPRTVVRVEYLRGALFIGPGRRHYYFGDYFAAPYAQRGFVAFFDYRPTLFSYDPIYSYYRRDQTWHRDFRKHAVNVPALTTLPKLPRDMKHVASASAAAHVGPALTIKTHPLKKEEQVNELRQIRHGQQAAQSRRQHEGMVLAQAAAPHRAVQQPKAAPLVLPRAPVARPVANAPPRPAAPRAVPRPAPPPMPAKAPRPPRRGSRLSGVSHARRGGPP